MTRYQAQVLWNAIAKSKRVIPMGSKPCYAVDDPDFPTIRNLEGYNVTSARAVVVLREMADALDGCNGSNNTAGNDGGNKEES